MKFGVYVEVDELCTTICSMTWFKVKVTSPSKLQILSFSTSDVKTEFLSQPIIGLPKPVFYR